MAENMKRIHSIKIERLDDTCANTSGACIRFAGSPKREKAFKAGEFNFIGIRAKAEIHVPNNSDYMTLPAISSTGEVYNTQNCLIQTISSGGLWGIEDDSDAAYLKEIEQEELSELAHQLYVIGFSKRAIAAAMKEVQHAS